MHGIMRISVGLIAFLPSWAYFANKLARPEHPTTYEGILYFSISLALNENIF